MLVLIENLKLFFHNFYSQHWFIPLQRMRVLNHPNSSPIKNENFEKEHQKKHVCSATVRCLLVRPSNCGKTIAMPNHIQHVNALNFEKTEIYSKVL